MSCRKIYPNGKMKQTLTVFRYSPPFIGLDIATWRSKELSSSDCIPGFMTVFEGWAPIRVFGGNASPIFLLTTFELEDMVRIVNPSGLPLNIALRPLFKSWDSIIKWKKKYIYVGSELVGTTLEWLRGPLFFLKINENQCSSQQPMK